MSDKDSVAPEKVWLDNAEAKEAGVFNEAQFATGCMTAYIRDGGDLARYKATLEDMMNPPLVLESDNAVDVASWFVEQARKALADKGQSTPGNGDLISRSTVDKLVAALSPFANAANAFDQFDDEGMWVNNVTLGELRRARAALADKDLELNK